MTFYVTIIFEDPEMDEHGYRIESETDIGCSNGIWSIKYIGEEPDKKNIVVYKQDSIFSVLVDEE